MNSKRFNLLGMVCILFAITTLGIVLVIKFTGEYRDLRPGIISDFIYKVSLQPAKQVETPIYPVISEGRGIFLTEGEECAILKTVALVIGFASLIIGVICEAKNVGSLWIPGGVLLSGYSLLLIFPLTSIILTLTTFIAILYVRDRKHRGNITLIRRGL